MNNLQQAEQAAIEAGYLISAEDRAEILKAQQAELNRIQTVTVNQKESGRFVAEFNRLYPKFLQFLIGVGEVILTLSQTIIVSLGVPLVLALLLVVEQQRVYHGIGLFEQESALASFAAWALVILNLTLEFTIEYIEHSEGYNQKRATRFSLRTWWRNMSYTLGMGERWQEQALSPAQRYRSLLSLVTFSILALALAGSMRSVIATTPGNWYQGIGAIVTESNLQLMITWIGGLLFAAAAVLSAQGLSRYVAIRCVEILERMARETNHDANQTETALDSVAAQIIMAKVSQKRMADQVAEQRRIERQQARQAEKSAREAVEATPLLWPVQNSKDSNHD